MIEARQNHPINSSWKNSCLFSGPGVLPTVIEKDPKNTKNQSKEKSSKKKTTQTNKEKKSSKTPKS